MLTAQAHMIFSKNILTPQCLCQGLIQVTIQLPCLIKNLVAALDAIASFFCHVQVVQLLFLNNEV